MANLYDLTGPMIEAEADRLIALGCFAMRSGVRKVKLKSGGKVTTMEIEKTRRVKLAPQESLPPISPYVNVSEDYDSLVVDGFPGSAERIEKLADYYVENEEKFDRRGVLIREAISSPSVLRDDEEADRLIEIIPQWAMMPVATRTPFQQLMIELAAESIIDRQAMEKLIVEQLGS